MSWDSRNLPEDRPSSFDEKGRRLFLYPGEVKGVYRRLRTVVYWILIFIFLVLPWTKFQGQQTILLNLPERQFTFFGFTFWAHDAPLIFFPLIISTLGLTLVTAIWGRVWCGWACPQTVFLDALFRKIETLIEGDYLKRMKFDRAPWTTEKALRKILKWSLFLLLSLHISHSFIAYFVGAERLIGITLSDPSENWTLFLIVQSLALVLFFNFSWFREQFCIIMCPYGRFQSVLMGRNSLAILYDEKRGEPRKSKNKGAVPQGDCVNCFRCVNVCPTGIDIRDGVQMECIACTACADACDEIMNKLNKPKGLIRYASEIEMSGGSRRVLTVRTWVYSLLLAGIAAIFVVLVFFRSPIDIKILRGIGAPYSIVKSEGGDRLVNHFRIHVSNHKLQNFELRSLGLRESGYTIVAPMLPLKIPQGEQVWVHFFLKRSDAKMASADLQLVIQEEGFQATEKIRFLGPQ